MVTISPINYNIITKTKISDLKKQVDIEKNDDIDFVKVNNDKNEDRPKTESQKLRHYTSDVTPTPSYNPEYGQMLTPEGKVFNRHTTYFARDDFNWSKFGSYLKERFPNLEDVDINVFGCSTGQEPYTLAMLLKKEYGDTPFTIKAMDISDDVIEMNEFNKEEGVIVSPFDYRQIVQNLNITAKDAKELFNSDKSQITLKKDVTDHVQFSKANILTSLDKINSEKPSIIFCRNMWPYINPDEYNDFAHKLYNKLAPGSIVVIGEFDTVGDIKKLGSDNFPKTLISNGFEPNCLRGDISSRRERLPLIYEKNKLF